MTLFLAELLPSLYRKFNQQCFLVKIVQPIYIRANKVAIILLVMAVLIGQNGFAESLQKFDRIVVDYIIDGDSLVVRNGDKTLEIRLWGIDSPEYDQPGSKRSKRKLKELTSGKKGDLLIKDRDRYGRYVAVLFSQGVNVNEEMIASGNSWVHIYYCREPMCEKWRELEKQARKDKRSIWKKENPIPPWQWKAKR